MTKPLFALGRDLKQVIVASRELSARGAGFGGAGFGGAGL
jgi:hypothetical protein